MLPYRLMLATVLPPTVLSATALIVALGAAPAAATQTEDPPSSTPPAASSPAAAESPAEAATLAGSAPRWPSFRGPGAAGLAPGPLPRSWNGETGAGVRWRTTIPGLGHSSPIVWDDRVFVTTAISSAGGEYPVGLSADLSSAEDRSEHRWKVYALDRATGEVRWEKTLHEGVPRSKRHRKNSYATPTPVTDGRHLVVFLGSEDLYGLTVEGELLWRRDLGDLSIGFYQDPTLQWGAASSPVIWKDRVIVFADVDREPFLAAFDLETGEPLWRVTRSDGRSWGSPALYRGEPRDLVVVNSQEAVRAYDPASGEEVWSLPWEMDIVQTTPIATGGAIYSACGKGRSGQPIVAVAPDAEGTLTPPGEDGEGGEAASQGVRWYSSRGGPITPTILVVGELLYSLHDIGVLRTFSAADGELVYQQRVPDSFLASPIAADGVLYLTAEGGDVYLVATGREYELLGVNPLGAPALATPAPAGDLLIFRTTNEVIAVDGRVPAAPAAGDDDSPPPRPNTDSS